MNEPLADKPTVLHANREQADEIFERHKRGEFYICWMQRGESKGCLWIFGVQYAEMKQPALL